MQKFSILIFALSWICCSSMKLNSQQNVSLTLTQKITKLTMQSEAYLNQMVKLINIHEKGHFRKFRFIENDSLQVGGRPTTGEKQFLISKFKANADSVIVKMQEIKSLLP